MALAGLDSALTGLRLAQLQMNTIANNISNVGTPGYTRKILPQSSVTVADTPAGVRVDTLTRNVNMDLQRDFWTQVSAVSYYDVQAAYLNKLQQFHGDPGKNLSISAAISTLRDRFSALSDSPEDHTLQRAVIDQAQTVAGKINALSNLVTDMRNDAQTEMTDSITKINSLLSQISTINKQIKSNISSGKTAAPMQDTRDSLVQDLSKELNVSFFIRSDGTMVVQTAQGQQLADETTTPLFFDPLQIGTQSSYPANVAGVYLGGDPATVKTAIDVTGTGLGGRLGALIDMRDSTMPRQQAEVDELANKLALRFEQQGLTLFTDASGAVPPDGTPIPNPPGPLTPVPYVGFAGVMRVNQAIINNNPLVQQGTATEDVPVPSGSNEVIRRIIQNTFGTVDHQEANGAVDLRSTATGGTTMQNWLGIFSSNQVTGTKNIASYSDLASMLAAGGTTFDPSPAGPPYTDQFDLTFYDSRLDVPLGANPAQTYTLSLSAIDAAYPIGPGINDALDQMVQAINNLAPPTNPLFAVTASRSPYGQLVITSRADITIDTPVPALAMDQAGLDFLGLTQGTVATKDPYIDIQVGNDNPVRVTIAPGEDETSLMAKLQYNPLTGTGIPGLYAEMDPLTGFLTLRPGKDIANGGPVFGGDLKIVGSLFTADGTGGSGAGAGDSIVKSLLGSDTPVTDVLNSTLAPFRTDNLGPNADVSTGMISSTDIINYAQNMINRQTNEVTIAESTGSDEKNYRDLLQRQHTDESGVNIEEELAAMISIQTAFSASARTVTAINDMFQELLRAI